MNTSPWIEQTLAVPYPEAPLPGEALLEVARQDFEELERRRSCIKTPLTIGSRAFERGVGTHSVSILRIYSPEPLVRFSAWVGVDHNARTSGGKGSVVFAVLAPKERFRSSVLRGGEEAVRVDVDLADVNELELRVDDAGDGPACDHADWADAVLTTRSGESLHLDELALGTAPSPTPHFPFSFVYGGRPADDLLTSWQRRTNTEELDGGRTKTTTEWTDPDSRLRVTWGVTTFADFPAFESLLTFENSGQTDTAIVEQIHSLDLVLASPLAGQPPCYRLYRTNGAPSNPTDFEPALVTLRDGDEARMGGGGGRSSNRDLPFLKLDTGLGSLIVAVGWSGQWQASVGVRGGTRLRLNAGLERAHFRLHPGERVRLPRVLVLHWQGDTWESNAQFRRLLYRHYVARRSGAKPLPIPYCNTCFTRGGTWLNECNAANQISLINAYAPLGIEALLTDAGWFRGGWPGGAGNWDPDPEKYPEGMAPVAAAAHEAGMVYGLWFEPERVVAGTWLHRHRPQWLLADADGPRRTYLLNFGLPDVQDHFFDIVKGFMDLPGFNVYRQDFNMDPLAYWRHHDAPDRQGLTEIRYIEGLYAFWDRIAAAWPDSLRIECASGGRRIDLETLTRMHVHQKSDYWFDSETDQASIWGLSQYLPNNVFMAPVNRMDDYSFDSALPTSLCLGWIADAPDFDPRRARELLARYRGIRHLLVGAWYPLLPYSRRAEDWMASQYHRPDLDEGLILAFRRPASPYRTVEVSLHGLDPEAQYLLRWEEPGEERTLRGEDLADGFPLTLPEPGRSLLIHYREAQD